MGRLDEKRAALIVAEFNLLLDMDPVRAGEILREMQEAASIEARA